MLLYEPYESKYEQEHNKTNKITCSPKEESD